MSDIDLQPPKAVILESGRFRGWDSVGNVVVAMELTGPLAAHLFALTPCCQASGKGSDSETGVVCRACYETVDVYFGGPAEITYPAPVPSIPLDQVVDRALDNFWDSIAKAYPTVMTGDMDPLESHRFSTACEDVVRQWLRDNAPEPEEVRA